MAAAVRVKQVTANGVELAYEESGEGERPFVLVHGFTGSRDDFREQMPLLGEHGWTLALDQRGHGESTSTGNAAGYSLDQLSRDLEAFLDALHIPSCDLLGHSMGGMVALRFVLENPDRVSSLVLMDTSAQAIEPFPRAIVDAAARLARAEGMGSVLEMARKAAELDPNRPQAVRSLVERMGPETFWERTRRKYLAMDPEAFAALWVELLDQDGVLDRLGEIRCPTVILVGDQDQPFLEAATALEKGIHGSRRVTVPDAAHNPQLENPEVWHESVVAHLRAVR